MEKERNVVISIKLAMEKEKAKETRRVDGARNVSGPQERERAKCPMMLCEGLSALTMSSPHECFVFDGPVLHSIHSVHNLGFWDFEMIPSKSKPKVKRILNLSPVNSGCIAGFRHLTSHLREPPMPPEKASHDLTASMSAVPKSSSTAEFLQPSPITEEIHAEGGRRKHGGCKWFNVAQGWGFITPDDKSQDVFVHQSVIHKSGFRSLADGERVEFEWRVSEKGIEATFVSGPDGRECRGSDRRPVSRKKFRKIRCYNCGDLGNHIAKKCPHGPLPKRCHFCKSTEHLIADCPFRDTNRKGKNGSRNGNSEDNDKDGAPMTSVTPPE